MVAALSEPPLCCAGLWLAYGAPRDYACFKAASRACAGAAAHGTVPWDHVLATGRSTLALAAAAPAALCSLAVVEATARAERLLVARLPRAHGLQRLSVASCNQRTLLAVGLLPARQLRSFLLRDAAIAPPGAEALAALWTRAADKLLSLSLDGTNAGCYMASTFAPTVRKLRSLCHLSLRNTWFRSVADVEALAAALPCLPWLTAVDLARSQMPARALPHLAGGLAGSPRLHVLNLHQLELDSDDDIGPAYVSVALLPRGCLRLGLLRLSGCELECQHLPALLESLRQAPLHTLALTNNRQLFASPADLAPFAELLRSLAPTLRHLHLEGTGLDDHRPGYADMQRALASVPLATLSLCRNVLRPGALRFLALMPSLVELSLQRMETPAGGGACHLAAVEPTPPAGGARLLLCQGLMQSRRHRLEVLRLGGNRELGATVGTLHRLGAALRRQARSLRYLSLSGVPLPSEAHCHALAEALRPLRRLEHLDLSGCNLPSEGVRRSLQPALQALRAWGRLREVRCGAAE